MYSQKPKVCKNELKFINNQIEYSVMRISCKASDGMIHTVIGEKVIVNLSNKQLDILNKLSCEQWVNLLTDEKTDWGTNVILYYLSGKSVFPYFDEKRRKPKEWVEIFKKKDIKMWEEKICTPYRQLWTIPTCDAYLNQEEQNQK